MNSYTIQSEKQSNGVWGTPLYCKKIDKAIPLSDENHLKKSAFLIAIAEICKQPFEVCLSNENGFAVRLYNDNKYICFSYDNYTIMGNTIIWNK